MNELNGLYILFYFIRVPRKFFKLPKCTNASSLTDFIHHLNLNNISYPNPIFSVISPPISDQNYFTISILFIFFTFIPDMLHSYCLFKLCVLFSYLFATYGKNKLTYYIYTTSTSTYLILMTMTHDQYFLSLKSGIQHSGAVLSAGHCHLLYLCPPSPCRDRRSRK